MRTYNTIISACNRSGQPEHALRVYERMLADGAQPTATTYTALISAYGKTGKVSLFPRGSRVLPRMVQGFCLHLRLWQKPATYFWVFCFPMIKDTTVISVYGKHRSAYT